MKILHVIAGLTTGGAERLLAHLAAELARRGHASEVVCLGPKGGAVSWLKSAGIPVHYLGARKGAVALLALPRLARLARRVRPDVVQGWMHDGNLAASVAGAFAGAPAYWSVHQSLYALRDERPVNRLILRAAALLSRLPRRIVYVSKVSALHFERFGFHASRTAVIPAGFDLQAFHPRTAAAKSAARVQLGLDPGRTWIGWMGRDDAKKDPANFIAAARQVRARLPEARFVMAGRGLDAADAPPRLLARAQGLEEVFVFRGELQDAPAFFGALDVFVSSSYTEAFPGVVGEAMACGIPCAVTDVGDAAFLVGETGLVAHPRDSAALAGAILGLAGSAPADRAAHGACARARILENFSLPAMSERYLGLYAESS